MIISYDIDAKSIALDQSGPGVFSFELRYKSERVDLGGIKVSVSELDAKFPAISWPATGTIAVSTDQKSLFSGQLALSYGETYRIRVSVHVSPEVDALSSDFTVIVPVPDPPSLDLQAV